MDQKR